jgi:hypothetical protein
MGMRTASILSLLCAAGLAAAAPVRADTLEQLDQLTDASVSEAGGLALARQQAGSQQWLEALATLDRLLALHPKSKPARMLQVVYLCRIDDRPGGLVALAKLKKKQYPATDWAEAQMACGVEAGK